MHIKNTLFVGKVLLDFPVLDSTNSYASELLSKSKPIEGTVISTFHQTQGRGQIGSTWESEPQQNISLSIILYPHFLLLREQFVLNLAISLAMRNFIAKYIEKSVKVKWPNDIYVENRKLVGILIQNTLSQNLIQSSIVGIGVNVNQSKFSDQAPNATSLALETGKIFSLPELVENLCWCVEQQYLRLKNPADYQAIREEYLQHLYRYETWTTFRRKDGSVFQGKIIGIASGGKLIVENHVNTEEFSIKEISFA